MWLSYLNKYGAFQIYSTIQNFKNIHLIMLIFSPQKFMLRRDESGSNPEFDKTPRTKPHEKLSYSFRQITAGM